MYIYKVSITDMEKGRKYEQHQSNFANHHTAFLACGMPTAQS
jgi:hypothetical protein